MCKQYEDIILKWKEADEMIQYWISMRQFVRHNWEACRHRGNFFTEDVRVNVEDLLKAEKEYEAR